MTEQIYKYPYEYGEWFKSSDGTDLEQLYGGNCDECGISDICYEYKEKTICQNCIPAIRPTIINLAREALSYVICNNDSKFGWSGMLNIQCPYWIHKIFSPGAQYVVDKDDWTVLKRLAFDMEIDKNPHFVPIMEYMKNTYEEYSSASRHERLVDIVSALFSQLYELKNVPQSLTVGALQIKNGSTP